MIRNLNPVDDGEIYDENRALFLRCLACRSDPDPDTVSACHCGECQRRTGSVFSVGAFFKKEHVRAKGPSKIYVRDGQEGRKVKMHFCPTCGTTVFWEADLRPDHIGVAVGAFHDPNFPRPILSAWEESKHGWVAFTHDHAHLPNGRPT
jgi:hypothetical protein